MKKLKKLKSKIKRPLIKIWAKVYRYLTLKWIYPHEYRKYASAPINEKKVVFIEMRYADITNSVRILYDEIIQNYDLEIHTHFLRSGFARRLETLRLAKAMIRDIATAKYIFIDDASHVCAALKLRDETKFVQLWHGCGAFKKFGFSTAELIFGESKKVQEKYRGYGPYSLVTVSSPEVAWAYEEAMRVPCEVIKPIGISRTDVFFDEQFIAKQRDKLTAFMPESRNKKVILYAPTFRGRVAKAKSPNVLDVELFKEHLSAEYVLVMKHHPMVKRVPRIAEEYQDFARDLTKEFEIDELLCIADICISDYSSLIYEYSLFEKPMVFYAYDLEKYGDWRGFYYSYEELTPGPIFTENEEMISYIEHVDDKFDIEQVRAFKEKFMSACDGQSTKRIMDFTFGDNINKYRKNVSNL
jgi:Putative glycosyl/glycerophosphate transferases involved in teichoic acid biosynthesis TagF/TagB/EpsJ/RodC